MHHDVLDLRGAVGDIIAFKVAVRIDSGRGDLRSRNCSRWRRIDAIQARHLVSHASLLDRQHAFVRSERDVFVELDHGDTRLLDTFGTV